MMSPTRFRLAVPLLALSLFGFGCFHLGPRIVRAPKPSSVAVTPTSTEEVDVNEGAQVLAYLRLNGGAATVKRAEGSVDGQDGAELLAGDEIDVKQGAVYLVYPDAGQSMLDEGSSVVILPQDGEEAGTVSAELQLLAGRVWTRFERLLGPNESFSVSGGGVVATVRGTAFGMELKGGETTVDVADHEVEVAAQADEEAEVAQATTTKRSMAQRLRLAAGESVSLTASQVVGMPGVNLKKFVKKLSNLEKRNSGYVFGSTPADTRVLRKPLTPIRLKLKAQVPETFKKRTETLKKRFLLEQAWLKFSGPSSTPTFMINTDGQLNIQGPGSQ